MSAFATAIITAFFVFWLAVAITDHADTKRVERMRFEHNGKIFMLVPAKLTPAGAQP